MTGRNPQILVIGSLNMDLVTRVKRLPAGGETMTAQSFTTGAGGKGANQAVASARLSRSNRSSAGSVDVYMIGAVGDDKFGEELIEKMGSDGIITSGIQKLVEEKTGIANIIVEEGGENRIMLAPNANGTDAIRKFSWNEEANVAKVAVFQLEIPLEMVKYHIGLAATNNAEVVFNPAPAIPLPDDIYRSVGHLIMNETEAAILSSRDAESVDPSDISRLSSISSKFLQLGVQCVVITLGGSGVFYHTLAASQASQGGQLIPARKVKVVDTTAAGDTFVGAYAVAVAQWRQGQYGSREWADVVPEALHFATRASSKTVEREGAQASIPWRAEVPQQ